MNTSRIPLLFLPLLLVVAAGYMWIYRNMTVDDTFIFAQFVTNMLEGGGMSFNQGEPTYGFTSVLWVALLYCAGLISGDVLLSAKAMSFLFALFSIAAFFGLAKRILAEPLYYYCATAAWAVNPIFVNMAFSGMETTLGTFLLISGLWLHFVERESRRAVLWAPALFALAYLTRPEFLLLLPLWLLDVWFKEDRSLRLKRLFFGVLVYGGIVGLWLVIAWVNFGTIVPNPVIIKAMQSRIDYDLVYAWKRFFLMLGSIHMADLFVILGALTAVIFLRGAQVWQALTRSPPILFLWLWVLGVLGSYLLQKVAVSPRYFLIVSPALTLLAFWHLRDFSVRESIRMRLAIPILMIFLLQSFVATAFIYHPHTVTYNAKDKLLKTAAEWLKENTPNGATVASVDIGILGYYSQRRVVDQTGLINPDIVKRTSGLAYLRGKDVDYLLDRNAEAGYLKKNSRDSEWLEYEPVLFLSTPSKGWTGGLTEGEQIGFTLYRLLWKSNVKADGERS